MVDSLYAELSDTLWLPGLVGVKPGVPWVQWSVVPEAAWGEGCPWRQRQAARRASWV